MRGDDTEVPRVTVIMDVRGVLCASSAARVEAVIGRRPGVLSVDANAVGQTATVSFDPARTSVQTLTLSAAERERAPAGRGGWCSRRHGRRAGQVGRPVPQHPRSRRDRDR